MNFRDILLGSLALFVWAGLIWMFIAGWDRHHLPRPVR
jgi:hypothetical protein